MSASSSRGLRLFVVVAAGGCHANSTPTCDAAFAQGHYANAAALCVRAFEERGDVEAGARALSALHQIGQIDAVLALAERLPPSAGDGHTWRLVGDALRDRRKLEAALPAYERALAHDEARGDTRAAARDAYESGMLLWRTSKQLPALDYARLSFAQASAAGDVEAQINAASMLAGILYDIGDLRASYRVLRAGAQLIDPAQTTRRARFRANEGSLLMDTGRPELARVALLEAMRLFDGKAQAFNQLAIHLNLANAYLRLKNLEAADRHLAEAWKLVESKAPAALHYRTAQIRLAQGRLAEAEQAARRGLAEVPSPNWGWQLHLQLGRVLEARSEPTAAGAAYADSIRIVEALRRSMPVNDLKDRLMTTRREPYETAFRLHARRGRFYEALEIAERVKARTFLDARLDARLEARATAADEHEVMTSLEQVSAAAAASLKALLPALDATPSLEPRPLGDVLAELGSRHVLAYFSTHSELWVIAVTSGRIAMRRAGASLDEIKELVGRFVADPDDTDIASQLGVLLLPPALLPPIGSRLSLVTDGIVTRLPFAALRYADRFLVERYILAYAPSLAGITALRDDIEATATHARILGDPFGDLEGAASEAQWIAATLGSQAALGSMATSAALRSSAGAPLLHLATHTGVGPTGPWLALADGAVDAATVLRWRLRPRSVVIAGCASGAHRDGEIWGSLAAAFLAAGSEAVLATLWSVADRPTHELITRFYDRGGMNDPAGALSNVQRTLASSGWPPSSWAAFVVLGQAMPVQEGMVF